MPKTYLTKQQKLNCDMAAWIYGQLKAQRIPQQTIADDLGITHQAFNYKLKTQTFKYEDLVAVFRTLKPDAQTIVRLMGADEWTRG